MTSHLNSNRGGFGVLCRRFKEVLLLDADVVPMRDPAYLFDDPQYRKDGNYFWGDIYGEGMFDDKALDYVGERRLQHLPAPLCLRWLRVVQLLACVCLHGPRVIGRGTTTWEPAPAKGLMRQTVPWHNTMSFTMLHRDIVSAGGAEDQPSFEPWCVPHSVHCLRAVSALPAVPGVRC